MVLLQTGQYYGSVELILMFCHSLVDVGRGAFKYILVSNDFVGPEGFFLVVFLHVFLLVSMELVRSYICLFDSVYIFGWLIRPQVGVKSQLSWWVNPMIWGVVLTSDIWHLYWKSYIKNYISNKCSIYQLISILIIKIIRIFMMKHYCSSKIIIQSCII